MEFTLDFSRTFFQVMLLISPILISLSSLIIGLGQVVGKIERWDRLDSLYWSLITATTVGYGDIRPKQHVSRVIAIAIAIMGVIFTGILVSIAIEATRHSVAIHVNAERLESYRQSEQLELIDLDLQRYVE